MTDDAIVRLIKERNDQAQVLAQAQERKTRSWHNGLSDAQTRSKRVFVERVNLEATQALARLARTTPPFVNGELIDIYDYWGRKSDSIAVWDLDFTAGYRDLVRVEYRFYLDSNGKIRGRELQKRTLFRPMTESRGTRVLDMMTFRKTVVIQLLETLQSFPSL